MKSPKLQKNITLAWFNMFVVYLGIGTNEGDRSQNIKDCTQSIKEKIGEIKATSSIYETEPWGVENQETYYNIVLKLNTSLYPLHLLRIVQEIETNLGRIRREKWGSRIIDIDILFYQDFVFSTPDLIIPHPYVDQRNFVLDPLLEIDSTFFHPKLKKSIASIRTLCKDSNWIKRLDT
jgi:2-amino-4-hydroxy-6-hydroxymethyldihydropteridine diphosphokinase